MATTRPSEPLRIRFQWRATEADSRFSGLGLARVEAPQRARLDLFGPRGEAYLSGILSDGLLALSEPSAAIQLPPPTLLWASLGVFLPPEEADLLVTRRDGQRLHLEYASKQARWRFFFEDDRLRRAEWDRSVEGRYTVELRGEAVHGIPREATYRDWKAFVELTLISESIDVVEPFPPDVWILF